MMCGILLHDYWFFTSHCADSLDFSLTRNFMLLELIIFYSMILSTMLFIVISKFSLKGTGLTYLQNDEKDFL